MRPELVIDNPKGDVYIPQMKRTPARLRRPATRVRRNEHRAPKLSLRHKAVAPSGRDTSAIIYGFS